jgi:hypothetical protein
MEINETHCRICHRDTEDLFSTLKTQLIKIKFITKEECEVKHSPSSSENSFTKQRGQGYLFLLPSSESEQPTFGSVFTYNSSAILPQHLFTPS